MGRTNCTPTPGKRLAIRVMQLHLCITYLCSGLMKSAGEQWWNGELLWRSLNLPVYRQFDMTWLANWPALLVVGGWLTLFLEIGYCIFIWHRNTRWIWIIAMLGLHLGIAIFLGLQFFGFTMCILTFSVFGISSEEGRLFAMGWNFNVPQLNAQRNGEFA